MDGSQIFQEHLMVESLNLTRTMRMSIVTRAIGLTVPI